MEKIKTFNNTVNKIGLNILSPIFDKISVQPSIIKEGGIEYLKYIYGRSVFKEEIDNPENIMEAYFIIKDLRKDESISKFIDNYRNLLEEYGN